MGCHRLTYHLTAKPRLRCVYNAADEDGNRVACPPMGNITFKTDAGTLEYEDPARPYQITGQINYPPTVNTDPRTIDYTSGERPSTITQSGNTATFSYNHAGQRTKMEMAGATANYTRTYLGGNYEHEVNGGATTERLYLGGTPYDAPAVAIRTNGGAWALHYIHRDYLGSIVALSDNSGAAVETNSYDAWGNRTLVSGTRITQRGYTGHEHLPEFGLINMNARLYDPVIGRMLSPDPYVQNPYFSQNYNRYSYCLNNPLKYTDPTGMIYMKDDRYVDNTIDAENDRLLAYHMGGFGGGGGSPYRYSSSRRAYVDNMGNEVPWHEVYSWLSATNSFASPNDATIKYIETTFGVSYNPDTEKFYGSYLDNGTYAYSTGNNTAGYNVYHDTETVGFSFPLNLSGTIGSGYQNPFAGISAPKVPFGVRVLGKIFNGAINEFWVTKVERPYKPDRMEGKPPAILQGAVLAIPPLGFADDWKILITGSNIYNNPADKWYEKGMAVFGIVTFGMSHWITWIPTGYSAISTTIENW